MKTLNNSVTGCRRCRIDEITNLQLVIQKGRCLETCNFNKYMVENYNRLQDEWFVCRAREQVILRQCQNCRCSVFDSGVFVSSFLDTVVLDPNRKYLYSEMKELLTSSVKTGTAVSEHQICRQCPEGSLPVLNSNLSVSSPSFSKYDIRPQRNINYFYKKNQSYFSFFNFIPEVIECTQYDMDNYESFPINPSILVKDIYSIYLRVDYSIFFNISDKSTLNNFRLCKGVNIGENSKVGCASCVFGYNGYLFYDTTEKINFMPECFFFYECKPEVYWRSLTSQPEFSDLYNQVSCHQCKALDQIVSILTFPVNFESLFEGEDPTNYNVTLTTLPKNFCYTPGILSGNLDPSGNKFPLNCAIQEVLALPFKSWDAGDLDNNNPVCRVCRPKFRPVYYTHSVSKKRYVQSCELIPNCAFSDEFNRCSQCESGYVFKYLATHSLSLRQNCIANSVDHCEIADSNSTCLKCKPSFHLLQNGSFTKCLRTPAYYCDREFTENDGYFDTGCQSCMGQFYSVLLPLSSMNLCLEDPLSSNSSCLTLGSDGTCVKCKQGFYRVENSVSCVQASISNCAVYKPNGDCHACSSGHVLTANKCNQGFIPGCLTYQDVSNCLLCESSLNLYKLNSSTICVDTSNMFPNCHLTSIDNTYTPPRAFCQKCSNHSFLRSISPVRLCLPLRLDPLCKKFDPVSRSSCTECVSSSYLVLSQESISGKLCVPRNNHPIYKCHQYQPDRDSCQECEDGYFLDVDQLACLPVEYQVPLCVFYDHQMSCFLCKSGHYPKDGKCEPVSTAIPNCLYQHVDSECLICEPSFLLSSDGSSCDSPDLSLDAHRQLICADLLRNPNLSGVDLRLRLLSNSCFPTLEPNCHSFDLSGQCEFCETDFYKDSFGKCSAISISIPNCQFYASNRTCQVCQEGFFISDNGQHCLRGSFPKNFNLTGKCNQLSFEENCVLCAPGYQMDIESGVCSKNQVDPECQVIDFDGTCLVCNSGFQMNIEFKCVENTHLIELTEEIRVSEK